MPSSCNLYQHTDTCSSKKLYDWQDAVLNTQLIWINPYFLLLPSHVNFCPGQKPSSVGYKKQVSFSSHPLSTLD